MKKAQGGGKLAPLLETGVLAILDTGIPRFRRDPVSGARALARAGIRFFQLRAKGVLDPEFLELAFLLRSALPGCVLTMNDRCDIAAASGVDGVHLGMDDLPPRAARAMLGRKAVIGASGGNNREVTLQCRERPNYLSVGPVYATATKSGAGSPLGTVGFRRLASMVPPGMARLAVGGITPDNVGGLMNSGADAVAAASWWWRGTGPGWAARSMLEAVAEARKNGRSTRRGRPGTGG